MRVLLNFGVTFFSGSLTLCQYSNYMKQGAGRHRELLAFGEIISVFGLFKSHVGSYQGCGAKISLCGPRVVAKLSNEPLT